MYLARSALRHALRGRASTVMAASRLTLPSLSHAFSTAPQKAGDTHAVAYPDMFCRQCEQTKDHYACVTVGVCGKTSETANVQDALIQQIKSVAHWAVQAVDEGVAPEKLAEVHKWTLAATFSTLTNVNFSAERIAEYIVEGEKHKSELKGLVKTPLSHDLIDCSGKTLAELEDFGLSVSVPKRSSEMGNDDAFSLKYVRCLTCATSLFRTVPYFYLFIFLHFFFLQRNCNVRFEGCIRVQNALCSVGRP